MSVFTDGRGRRPCRIEEGHFEYRIVLPNRGDGQPEYSPADVNEPTENDIACFRGSTSGPPYDEVWVERRWVREWQRT